MDHLDEVTAARGLLEDSGLVLHTRSQLDHLALDVLGSPGLGVPEVGRMRTFLERDWNRGVAALTRLGQVGEDLA